MVGSLELSPADGKRAVKEAERYLLVRKKYDWLMKPIEIGMNYSKRLQQSLQIDGEAILIGALGITFSYVISREAWKLGERDYKF